MAWKKLFLDAWGSMVEYVHVPDRPANGTFVIEEVEDCAPVIDLARALAERTPGRELRHAAVIPQHVMSRALRERWGRDDWRRWANDPDNRVFRTWPGRL